MKRTHVAMLLAAAVSLAATSIRADDSQVNQILDKAIKALGGEEKLGKADAFTWKTKGKLTIEGNENRFSSRGDHSGTRSLPVGSSRANSTATSSRACRS